MTLVIDRNTDEILGQLINVNALTGMIRVLVRGGGYRSILSEYVRLEDVR